MLNSCLQKTLVDLSAPPRPADVPAAPGDAEVPAHERDDSAGPREVIVNGHQQSFAGSS